MAETRQTPARSDPAGKKLFAEKRGPGLIQPPISLRRVDPVTSLFAPALAELSIFVLMAVVLLIRPQGLFGKSGFMS